MRTIGGNTWLECADMQRAGISYDTLKSARARGSKGFTIINDPEDRRRILVRYDDLKPQVKTVVDAVFGNAVKDQGQSDLKTLVKAHPSDIQTLRTHVLPDGTNLPPDAQYTYVRACAYLRLLADTPRTAQKRLGHATTENWHTAVVACAKSEAVELPTTYAALRRKLREFATQGAVAVVSGKWGNSNRRIIEGPIEDFLISVYALPTKPDVEKVMARYVEVAKEKGWPILSREAVWTHLHRRPEVRRRWYIGRHGVKAWKLEFGHLLKRIPPTFRDAMWCSDGTKLNIFYQAPGGMAAVVQVYLVIDVFSERILGWSLGMSENYRMQYEAMKMALRYAQAKPLQMQYDGQGGHKKKESQNFFDQITKLHFRSLPREPQAKTIEGVIGRLQMQVMSDDWAFTGQNIQAKRLDSRPNIEFIKANMNKLPTKEELPARVQGQVDAWNNRKHPRDAKTRTELYESSVNPEHTPLELLDMVDLFWHITARPIVYRKEGITLQVGEQRHVYEVFNAAGQIDETFRAKYIGAKFFVKYDLEDLDHIILYNEHMHCVAAAQTKQLVAMAAVDARTGDRTIINHSLAMRAREIANTWAELGEHTESSGVDRETLIELAPYATVDKQQLAMAESKLSGAVDSRAAENDDDDDDDDTAFNPYANL